MVTTPWIVYGQTQEIVQGTVWNPVANRAGAIGEASLPYTVPAGKELVIKMWGTEAYSTVAGGVVMFLWLGSAPYANSKSLHSVYADNMSNQTDGFEYHLPAGTIVNAAIQSNEGLASIVGWVISGELRDAA